MSTLLTQGFSRQVLCLVPVRVCSPKAALGSDGHPGLCLGVGLRHGAGTGVAECWLSFSGTQLDLRFQGLCVLMSQETNCNVL